MSDSTADSLARKRVINVAQSGNVVGNIGGTLGGTVNISTQENVETIDLDLEARHLLDWLAREQGLDRKTALKKALATVSYIHELVNSQGGKLFVQRSDKSIGEIILK